MAGFFNCGFARVAAKTSVYNENGKLIKNKSTRLQKFMSIFSDNAEAFAVSQNAFDKRLPVLLKNFEKWRGKRNQSTWNTLAPLHGDPSQQQREECTRFQTAEAAR